MIKSPKEKFQSSQPRCQQWEQIVANPIFEEACDAAMLQLQSTLPDSPITSNAQHAKLIGAQHLIYILKTIHETTQEPKKPTIQGLNYNEGV